VSVHYRAALLDIDGVLVNSPHERAWRNALRDMMEAQWDDVRARTTWSPHAFTTHLYQELVSGKPRLSGARSVLGYFQVPDDEQGTRAAEYAKRKQQLVERFIAADEFTAYPDGLRFVISAKDRRLRLAAASSSTNATSMMSRIRLDAFADEAGIASPSVRPGLTLLDVFDVNVRALDVVHGKPHPEMFLTAASRLRLPPRLVFVVEDAPAGVRAAQASGMRAIGVARADDHGLLVDAGADLVVSSLDEVDLTTWV
jgi:beta-phosphoglucomutase-like phosphatase (HAD superfamily)